jgi:cytochrome c-type biogenesis protein CcmF
VLWGVVYPLVSEAVRGVAVTVGAPYYNFFAVAFGLPLVLLMGLGPLVAWRRASVRALGASLLVPLGVAVVVGGGLAVAGAGSSPLGLIGYTFAAFVLAAIGLEFVRGTRARKALGTESWAGAFFSLVGRNRRRYGGYVVHASMVLLLVGAVGIGAYGTTREARLAPGESLRAGDYTVTYQGSREQRGANAVELRARLAVSRDGDELGTVAAGKNRYLAEEQVSNEVAVRSDLLRGEDLFVIADQFNPDGSVYFKVLVNPLVNLIWISGFVFLLGALVAMWPDAREQARLARRFADDRLVRA